MLLVAGGAERPHAAGVSLMSYLTGTSQSQLGRIKESGTLRVLTRVDPTTYFEGSDGLTGLEYDLINQFAKRLGVKAEFIVPDSFERMIDMIAAGRADIAAAGLTVTEQRTNILRFTPPYQKITEQIVYRSGKPHPRSIVDLTKGRLEVVKGTSHIETLEQWKENIPKLKWHVNTELNNDELLYRVANGRIDYTIADSNKINLVKRFYPELRVAFDLSNPRPLAWALPKSDDSSLYDEAARFFEEIKQDNTLAQLIDRHYGHADALDDYSNRTFRKHVDRRLPEYRKHFQAAADRLGIDWRLLAAIGYQESHWHREAVSPTGVRGIMMLTSGTARDLGVRDRTDPAQSIDGGSRYFMERMTKISKKIPQPDRTWMALAAYNVGFGHLQDARMLARKQGTNPDRWVDVKKYLLRLGKPRWHRQTKYGYARGWEPVRYVENIRYYYDLLVWLTEGKDRQQRNGRGTTTLRTWTADRSMPADELFAINVLNQTLAL